LRAEHVLGQLEDAAGADLLAEVGAARREHPGDLAPPRRDRVAARHEIERGVNEGQRLPVLADPHDMAAARPEPRARDHGVRLVSLGRDQEGRPCRERGEQGTVAALEVEHVLRSGGSLGHALRIAPARSLL
jgi:hypothetical protein